MLRIHVVPIALHKQLSLQDLCIDLEKVFHVPVASTALPLPVGDALDASRRQYHSAKILAMILERAPHDASKILGVTSYDLFLPVLTFLFGQAQVDNRASIFSTFRLHNEFYGLPASPKFLYNRSLKEAIHELGHTFGLRHCINPGCAMNASTYVEDIDLKEANFCYECDSFVQSKISNIQRQTIQ